MPVVPPLDTDRYYLYQEVAEYVRAVEEAAPHLVRLFSIGTSYEGRPLLLAEVTNRATGEGLEKPALWLDGNLHGSELSGSAACLEVLRQLASNYGRDPGITDLLDRCTFYIVPRLSPDGAEHCLTTGELVISGTRPGPGEEFAPGLHAGDINGDGRVLQMRQEDPLGEWKVSKRDPRVMVRRQPDDQVGPFYRLYREGFIEGPRPVKVPSERFRLDFDRNFPYEWRPEVEGAGPYPLSEPETRAVADFFRSHPNLCMAISCQSRQGAVLRPCEAGVAEEDLALYRELGKRVEELCGYPCKPSPGKAPGNLVDWLYHHLGVLSFTPQMWSLGRASGLEMEDPDRFFEERSEVETVALLRWMDREMGGHGFVAWSPWEHPQLGYVELGGWDLLHTFMNPPPGAYLRDEVDRCCRLVVGLASSLPRLVVQSCREEVLGWSEGLPGEDPVPVRKVSVEFENQGYLATWVTSRARQASLAQPLEVRLHADPNTQIVLGPEYSRWGHLGGTGTVDSAQDAVWFRGSSEDQRGRLEWVVRGEGAIQVELRQERAGTVVAVTRMERAAPPLAARGAAPSRSPLPPPPPPPPPLSRPTPAAPPALPPPPPAPVHPAARPVAPAPPPLPARPAAAPVPQPVAPARPAAVAGRPNPGAPARPLTAPPPAAPVRPAAVTPPPPSAPPARPGPPPPGPNPIRPFAPAAAASANLMSAGMAGAGLAAPVAAHMMDVPPVEPSKGRVLGSPPARPGGNYAAQAQEMVTARRPDAAPANPQRASGEVIKPLTVPPASGPAVNDAFSPGLVLRPAYGSGPRPAESAPATIPPEEPPEAPAAESRLPPLFLRKRGKDK